MDDLPNGQLQDVNFIGMSGTKLYIVHLLTNRISVRKIHEIQPFLKKYGCHELSDLARSKTHIFKRLHFTSSFYLGVNN